jgi:hypothetical protein
MLGYVNRGLVDSIFAVFVMVTVVPLSLTAILALDVNVKP